MDVLEQDHLHGSRKERCTAAPKPPLPGGQTQSGEVLRARYRLVDFKTIDIRYRRYYLCEVATRLTRVEQGERNRGRVLAAARRVFLDRGYAGATLEAIAEEAGFSKGVVYSQFAGKPDLFLALLEARIAERAEQNALVSAGLAGLDGLRALLEANVRLSEEGGDWSRLLIEFRVIAAREPVLNARYAALHAQTLDHFTEAIASILARAGLTSRTPRARSPS